MNATPRTVSVIIPWCDRGEIAESLRANAPWFSRPGVEVILSNCGGDEGILRNAVPARTGGAVRVVSTPVRPFNKCLALNLGVAASTGSVLIFLDADVVLEDDFMRLAAERLDGSAVVTVDRVAESVTSPVQCLPAGLEVAYSVEITLPGGSTVRLETNRVRPQEGTRSGPGLVAVEHGHFLAVQGMNSHLRGWGWEDLDLLARLQFQLSLRRVAVGRVLHLSHGDEVRALGGHERGASEQSNYLTCLAKYAAGHLFGTYAEDVAASRPDGA